MAINKQVNSHQVFARMLPMHGSDEEADVVGLYRHLRKFLLVYGRNSERKEAKDMMLVI